MSQSSASTMDNTRTKLQMLEAGFVAAQADHSGSAHARELELRSLKQLINQLKEELVRAESRGTELQHDGRCDRSSDFDQGTDRGLARIENDQQLENTRGKLTLLQQLVDEAMAEPGKSCARELTIQSLNRRIKRLKEEMLLYTVRQTEKARQ